MTRLIGCTCLVVTGLTSHATLGSSAERLRADELGHKSSSVATLLDHGQAGVAWIRGKHGGEPREFAVVQVVIRDQPGELARLFDGAGAAGVNIEDVRIERGRGWPVRR